MDRFKLDLYGFPYVAAELSDLMLVSWTGVLSAPLAVDGHSRKPSRWIELGVREPARYWP
jgi:hypothetical protein